MLSVDESLNFLKDNGMPIAKSVLVNSESEAVNQALKIGYPVVLKVVSSKLTHKTDVGGVITGLVDEVSVRRAYNQLINLSKSKGVSINGLLVQEQLSGIELIIGVNKDPVFNQVILLGIGGVLVELIKDVSLRVCPVNKKEALRMINELKAKKLLAGYRGKEGVNTKKLADLISKVSRLAVKKSIKEMDINPLIMKGSKALIVDARLEF